MPSAFVNDLFFVPLSPSIFPDKILLDQHSKLNPHQTSIPEDEVLTGEGALTSHLTSSFFLESAVSVSLRPLPSLPE